VHVALELATSWAFVFGDSCREFLENLWLLLSLKFFYGINPRPATEITDTELAVRTVGSHARRESRHWRALDASASVSC